MAMFPYYPRGHDWWATFPNAPERVFDQFFGEPLSPFHHQMHHSPFAMMPYTMRPIRQAMNRAVDEMGTGFSDVMNDDHQFGVRLDVSHFKPEELKVTTEGNQLVVKGDHQEQADEHGYIERHFVRKYQLPKGCNPESVKSELSRDGVLMVTAPKQAIEGPQQRQVPITAGSSMSGAKKAVDNTKKAVQNGK